MKRNHIKEQQYLKERVITSRSGEINDVLYYCCPQCDKYLLYSNTKEKTMFKREAYFFTHPKIKAPKVIRAFSEHGAWKKMRAFIISEMFGDWVMVYDSVPVNKVMKGVKLKSIEEK